MLKQSALNKSLQKKSISAHPRMSEGEIDYRKSARAEARGSFFGIFIIAVFSSIAYAQIPLDRSIRSAIASMPQAKAIAGVCVLDVATGETIFAHQADKAMIPASTMKVFTLAAGILELGPSFTFDTILGTDGSNVYIIGSGDPGFGDPVLTKALNQSVTSVFERWADVLIQRGITTIQGDIVIDASIFDQQIIHPAWENSDLGKWYAAPVSGLNINDNCLDITIRPASASGALALVNIIPDNTLAQIINKCRSGGKGKAILHHPPGTWDYRISGRCNKRWPFGPVAFPDPAALTADAFRTVLQKKGIEFAGQLVHQRMRQDNGQLSPEVFVLDIHQTSMADILSRIGKNSQNLFAECLLKRLGVEWSMRNGLGYASGSWKSGSHAVQEILKRTGVNTTGLIVSDGSGLSRKNRCTARQLADTLMQLHQQFVGELVWQSLAVPGETGSLRKRMKKLKTVLRGKTGTMRGISALSGYVDTKSGRRLSFGMIFNGYKSSSTPYKAIQDRICKLLANSH
ncbi:D-alanyl-D-alanine carboxypeptidase/D-alanyl-D-alanine-endopeptidase [bacterium AH-315-J04]|nr:D-alanyl-D-alanine carboxypeptidase/D-alanyl-D-alanine-endopeptidase [bacterium AH-315-J04]